MVCPCDERSPFGIDLDGASLATFCGDGANVAVAQWCPARRTAAPGVLVNAFHDLGGEVSAVEPAEYFAGCVLMPGRLVKAAYYDGIQRSESVERARQPPARPGDSGR